MKILVFLFHEALSGNLLIAVVMRFSVKVFENDKPKPSKALCRFDSIDRCMTQKILVNLFWCQVSVNEKYLLIARVKYRMTDTCTKAKGGGHLLF